MALTIRGNRILCEAKATINYPGRRDEPMNDCLKCAAVAASRRIPWGKIRLFIRGKHGKAIVHYQV